jgi:hypothetical protein
MASRSFVPTRRGRRHVGTEGADGLIHRVGDAGGAHGAQGHLALLDSADHRDVHADSNGELLPCKACPYAGLLYAGAK